MRLLETCLEAGPLSEKEITDALAGTRERKELLAVMSLLECFIAQAHEETRARGQEARIRDEAAGAARYLIDLRAELIEKTAESEPTAEEISGD